MATATATKPSYLGTLNAISLAESNAGVYLEAWANATPDEDLANCLRLVAARETSHGDVFCRRISELGFELMPKPDPGAAARIAKYANPRISDLEKMGEDRGEQADPFLSIEEDLNNGIYDPLTELLMRWYIAEERDSGRLLRETYACVREKAGASVSRNGSSNGKSAMSSSGPSTDAQAIMECMTAGFARLERSLEAMAKAKK